MKLHHLLPAKSTSLPVVTLVLLCIAALALPSCARNRGYEGLHPRIQQAAREQRPSPAMKAILRNRWQSEYDFSFDGMRKIELSENGELLEPIEIFEITAPKRTADMFEYRIFRFRGTTSYAIIVTGGFAGVHDVYAQGLPQNVNFKTD